MSSLPVMELILPQPTGGNVPAFLSKLWKMVNNPEFANLICWSDDGNSFLIKNQTQFAASLLPYYYKHSNMASFIRQLNMYDFHKVMNAEAGGLKGDNDEIEFAHPLFQRGQEHLLEQIKRKVSVATRGATGSSIKTEKVTEVLSEVGMLKGRQAELNGKLSVMRSENAQLWGEVQNLRQRHAKQERIVNKLIQFLGAMVQPQGNSLKRKLRPSISMLQLAIQEDEPSEKEPKVEFPEDVNEAPSETIEPKYSYSLAQNHDPTSQTSTVSDIVPTDFQTPVKRPVLQRQMTKEDLDVDVGNMQADLDSLKDIISGQITLDMDTVASLFDGTVDAMPVIPYDASAAYEDAPVDSVIFTTPEIVKSSTEVQENSLPVSVSELTNLNSLNSLNTPLVQEESLDPLRQLMTRKKDLPQ